MRLSYVDHRNDPAAWARWLGISREAVELHLQSDVIDLHIDSFIWTRIIGYDLLQRHGRGVAGDRFYSQVDFPRALEAGLTGAIWVITTNPLRRAASRSATFVKNLAHLRSIIAQAPEDLRLVRSVAEYRAARAEGKHGAFIGIQGGNALDADPSSLDLIEDDAVLRITLVHLSNSALGSTSAPFKPKGDQGLTPQGRDYVRRLDDKKIFVDLAHISKRGFWDALDAHDKSHPVMVTHTGVEGVFPHWRNLDDDQIKAVADTGGTVGIMLQSSFLTAPSRFDPGLFQCSAAQVVGHIKHVRDLVGADHVSIGTDFDGMISPPKDLASVLEFPRFTQLMLDEGFSPEEVSKVLGGSFLRTVALLRG